uniref:Uncharacterized protein n=1 Tax=Arion vulgaris TaxID=1028688 RepID=A0A0B7BFG0_9EUPU
MDRTKETVRITERFNNTQLKVMILIGNDGQHKTETIIVTAQMHIHLIINIMKWLLIC